jgi:hypothetical protein
MLFKSDVPMSHRVAFFLAGMSYDWPMQRMCAASVWQRSIFPRSNRLGPRAFTSGDNDKP